MLWPEPQVLVLAGLKVRVCELKIRTIGSIENDLERLAGHPHNHIEDLRRDLAEARSGPDRKAWIPIAAKLVEAQKQWPPRMGSRLTTDLLNTPEGIYSYLWHPLRQTHPRLKFSVVLRLADEMTAEDWCSYESAIWGDRPWECDAPPRKPTLDINNGRNWGLTVKNLVARWRIPFQEIGELYISQVDFLEAALLEDEPTKNSWIVPNPKPEPVTSGESCFHLSESPPQDDHPVHEGQ